MPGRGDVLPPGSLPLPPPGPLGGAETAADKPRCGHQYYHSVTRHKQQFIREELTSFNLTKYYFMVDIKKISTTVKTNETETVIQLKT